MQKTDTQVVYIGIDPSISSTGITVNVKDRYEFYIITDSLTKKEQLIGKVVGKKYQFQYLLYNKEHVEGEYADKERIKTFNFLGIVEVLQKLLKKYKKWKVVLGMEGISYGSSMRTSAVFDLAGLNYLIRAMMYQNFENVQLYVITPSANKKFATGKGNATKEVMQVGVLSMFPKLSVLKKADDVADSFWLCEGAKIESQK